MAKSLNDSDRLKESLKEAMASELACRQAGDDRGISFWEMIRCQRLTAYLRRHRPATLARMERNRAKKERANETRV